jgi:hypothetical protein
MHVSKEAIYIRYKAVFSNFLTSQSNIRSSAVSDCRVTMFASIRDGCLFPTFPSVLQGFWCSVELCVVITEQCIAILFVYGIHCAEDRKYTSVLHERWKGYVDADLQIMKYPWGFLVVFRQFLVNYWMGLISSFTPLWQCRMEISALSIWGPMILSREWIFIEVLIAQCLAF